MYHGLVIHGKTKRKAKELVAQKFDVSPVTIEKLVTVRNPITAPLRKAGRKRKLSSQPAYSSPVVRTRTKVTGDLRRLVFDLKSTHTAAEAGKITGVSDVTVSNPLLDSINLNLVESLKFHMSTGPQYLEIWSSRG